MTLTKFLKLQWIKRKALILVTLVVSFLVFSAASSYKDFHFKAMSILTGDHYYTMFTVMLPANEELTELLITEAKNWSGVANISEINTRKIISQMKTEYKMQGLDLPEAITEKPMRLFSFRIDPFMDVTAVEKMKEKILNHYAGNKASASPIRAPQLKGNYNVITMFMLEHGVVLLCSFLTLLVFGLNAMLFYLMVVDAKILHSIHRSKAISLKNYLIFQFLILLLSTGVYFFISGSLSLVTIMVWISIQSMVALIFYGLWGKKYQT